MDIDTLWRKTKETANKVGEVAKNVVTVGGLAGATLIALALFLTNPYFSILEDETSILGRSMFQLSLQVSLLLRFLLSQEIHNHMQHFLTVLVVIVIGVTNDLGFNPQLHVPIEHNAATTAYKLQTVRWLSGLRFSSPERRPTLGSEPLGKFSTLLYFSTCYQTGWLH